MTSVVNSSTNQKPIITLSAQSLRGGATVDLREGRTLIFQGYSSAFFFYYRVFPFSVLVNILILPTKAQFSPRLV